MQENIPKIGHLWEGQGGINVGLMRAENENLPDYYLILPTAPEAFIEEIVWSESYTKIDGANYEYDGLENTLALIKSGIDHPAAAWARSLIIEGHTDLYLPSRRENVLILANASDFIDKNHWYWSSTQYSASNAWIQYFEDGYSDIDTKYDSLAARAVRRYYPLNNLAI